MFPTGAFECRVPMQSVGATMIVTGVINICKVFYRAVDAQVHA
jgi:hypothetical protein